MVSWAAKLVPEPIKKLIRPKLRFSGRKSGGKSKSGGESKNGGESEKNGIVGGDPKPSIPQSVPVPGAEKAESRRLRPYYTFRSRGTRVEDATLV